MLLLLLLLAVGCWLPAAAVGKNMLPCCFACVVVRLLQYAVRPSVDKLGNVLFSLVLHACSRSLSLLFSELLALVSSSPY